MTKREIAYMDYLLLTLIEQRRRLDEMIKSVREVLKYKRSTQTSMRCTEIKVSTGVFARAKKGRMNEKERQNRHSAEGRHESTPVTSTGHSPKMHDTHSESRTHAGQCNPTRKTTYETRERGEEKTRRILQQAKARA